MNRRRYLALLGGFGLSSLAGCSSTSDSPVDIEWNTTPVAPTSSRSAPTPTTSPAPPDRNVKNGATTERSETGQVGSTTKATTDGGGGGTMDDGNDGGGSGGSGGNSTPTKSSSTASKTVTVTGNGAAPSNTGDSIRYIIETSGTMEPSDNADLESEDVVGESSAAGWVPADGSDPDGYALSGGNVIDVSTWGGDVTVTVDGSTWSG